MKSIADRQKLYEDYISHYDCRNHEGHLRLCDPELQYMGGTRCDSPAPLGESYSQLIRQNLQTSPQERRAEVLKQMMKGFAILELICVNLFLFPWRKEIRTVKKFTGNFVYFVEPVIPEDTIRQILQRVGYSISLDTEYIIGGKINTEEAKRTAFELYLARIQCEKMLWLMKEDQTACVSLLVNEPSTDPNNAIENTGYTSEDTCRTTGVHEIDGANNLGFTSNITGNNDTMEVTGQTITYTSTQDVLSVPCENDSSSIRHVDSDEFLNKYSDLNLAQKPIFPLRIKQTKAKEWAVPVSEEPNVAKPHCQDSFLRNFAANTHQGKDLAEKVTCGLQGDNIDIRTFTDELETPKSLIFNESSAEVIAPTKQERMVTKLKMKNVAEESLAYPIEETLPPDSAKLSDSSDLARKEVKWAFLKTKEGTESVASPLSLSSDYSMVNISNKSVNWTISSENRLREPPNSAYIPPVTPESECMRSPDIKPEENHFQVPSAQGDALLVNDFKMHEDTKEDYVMITKKDHLQH